MVFCMIFRLGRAWNQQLKRFRSLSGILQLNREVKMARFIATMVRCHSKSQNAKNLYLSNPPPSAIPSLPRELGLCCRGKRQRWTQNRFASLSCLLAHGFQKTVFWEDLFAFLKETFENCWKEKKKKRREGKRGEGKKSRKQTHKEHVRREKGKKKRKEKKKKRKRKQGQKVKRAIACVTGLLLIFLQNGKSRDLLGGSISRLVDIASQYVYLLLQIYKLYTY